MGNVLFQERGLQARLQTFFLQRTKTEQRSDEHLSQNCDMSSVQMYKYLLFELCNLILHKVFLSDWLRTLSAEIPTLLFSSGSFIFLLIACHTFQYVFSVQFLLEKKKEKQLNNQLYLPFSVYQQCYRCYCSYSQSIPL